jgi:hypothetical protein
VLWVQGDLDRSATLLKEALRTFREIGDRATVASVETGYSKVLLLKNDLPGAREALTDSLKIYQDAGVKGDAAFIRVLLAQLALLEGHADQVDEASVASSIEEIHAEQHGGDEVEALAIEIELFLAKGEPELAEKALVRGQGIQNASWLSKYHLMVAAARIDASQGRIAASRRKLETARSQAEKVGCRACGLESTSIISKSYNHVYAKARDSF